MGQCQSHAEKSCGLSFKRSMRSPNVHSISGAKWGQGHTRHHVLNYRNNPESCLLASVVLPKAIALSQTGMRGAVRSGAAIMCPHPYPHPCFVHSFSAGGSSR
jgi:hypothetical protein